MNSEHIERSERREKNTWLRLHDRVPKIDTHRPMSACASDRERESDIDIEREQTNEYVRVVKCFVKTRRFSRTEHFSAYPVQLEPASR